MKKIFLVILILAMVIAIPLAAQAAEYEEYNPQVEVAQPMQKPVVAMTSFTPVSYSGLRIFVIGNSEEAVVNVRGDLEQCGGIIVFDRFKTDIIVNITEERIINNERSQRSNNYGTPFNAIRINTGGNGYYGNSFYFPAVINHEKTEQKTTTQVVLRAEAVYIPTSGLIASEESSATIDKKYTGGSDGVAGILQTQNESSGDNNSTASIIEARRQASKKLANQLFGKLRNTALRQGGGTVELIFDYKNYPKIGDRVEILVDDIVVGEGKIGGLVDDGWQWRAVCQLLSGTKPASCNWRIKK